MTRGTDKERVLIVDDEQNVRRYLEFNLQKEGYAVRTAPGGREALAALEGATAAVLLDIRMPGIDGLETLRMIREYDESIPVIMMTAHGSIDTAVDAMKRGAYDYVQKPFNLDKLKIVLKNAVSQHRLARRVEVLSEAVRERYDFRRVIGSSPAMQDIFRILERVIPSNVSVFLQGESGTGKEVLARTIHFNSPRAEKPFVAVNCAAIPEPLLESELFGHERGAFTGAVEKKLGRFERAHGGTLFLDEIGEMPRSLQAKILRALQDREVERVGGGEKIRTDVRILSDTNKDLEKEVKSGAFREDLYYRLAVFPVVVPPLRERPEDIAPLARHFIEKRAQEEGREIVGMTGEAMEAFEGYPWPGNVRELENVVSRAVVLCPSGAIGLEHLPAHIVERAQVRAAEGAIEDVLGESIRRGELVRFSEFEEQLYRHALKSTNGNVSMAASKLGIARATFYRKVRKYNIDCDEG
ncbi:MAG: sigma-54 dependent transcriptional regulator [Candidatus Methylomirabilis sp.]|nr:sigma-54 dependent transcriptional regulator [Deltaproteobacteria bacterium]